MLDLKELERKLDAALANETKESLLAWLEEKRLRNFLTSTSSAGALRSCTENRIFKSNKVKISWNWFFHNKSKF